MRTGSIQISSTPPFEQAPARPGAGLVQARRRQAWLLVAPAMLALVAIAGWPLVRTAWFSLTDAQLADLSQRHFVSLDNYLGAAGVLRDPAWWQAVGNTVLFAVVSVLLETGAGLGVALLLDVPSRLRTLLRAAVLVPWAIPTVVSAKIWSWMLNDQFGIVNAMLMAVGAIHEPLAFTADAQLVFPTIVLVDVWKTTPFMALLMLAALQTVPRDCYEAARVDGVPRWRVFRSVTLPLILPGVLVAMIFRSLDALRVFDLIYVMTSNSRVTKSMSVYVREQLIDFQQVGFGSASAMLLFVTIVLFTVGYMAVSRRRMQEA
ncbi:ABC transporter permease [Burkholderia ubonensis]|uniref:carbohydrate ABC transporter permease n=1 Tax=Burkholderia ubonensis TaxID=101571 RepID=UPI0007573D98|nr:sugar ABC transporter permease [Burkholderia ubonensis]KVO73461.1 ABC transporter permease [Burkholderia ubonensis]KVP84180.1 ABC transporter permease [Burkholderia ubonensis]OJA24290.1 ABC transporter permease [Burkholderia ubonensis]OJB32519.1 ABC transporter permease [Burkholderia ubonensis]